MICVVSANLGNFDKPKENVEQSVPHDFKLFTDENFPPRFNAMTPRLQARIPKCFSWQMLPNYDYYLWVDSSCRLSDPDSIAWFMQKLGDADMVVFKHPNRNTVQEEADYLKHRLEINCPYICPRYENEDIDGQLTEVDPNAPLYASTAFMCRNTVEVQLGLKEWWYHISRYHSIDQLSLPWVTRNLRVNMIQDKYMEIPYLEYTR